MLLFKIITTTINEILCRILSDVVFSFSMRKISVFFIFMAITFFASGQKIKGAFENDEFEDKTIYLKEILGDQSYLLDSANIDAQGKFEFGARKHPLGYYSLGFEDNAIQIILNPSEEALKVIFGNKRLKEKVQILSSEENMLLWNFKYKSRAIQFEKASLNQLIAKQPEKEDSIQLVINGLNLRKQNFKDSLLSNFPNSFFTKTIKSSLHIPYEIKEEAKSHYFDLLDFSDESLVRSNIFPSKIMKYLQVHTPYDESGFKASIDMILEKSKANEMVYNLNLNFLLSLFDEIGPDVVYEHIINEYVLTDGCFDTNISDHLATSISEYEKLLVGKIAPDVRLSNEMTLLNAICEAKYTVLFFWSSQCQFCHDQLSVLKQLDEEFLDTVDIVALSLDIDYQQWQNAIEREGLPWAHYSDLNGWDSEYVSQFKINKTPSYYVLNSNGTIIAKPGDAKTLKVLLEKL